MGLPDTGVRESRKRLRVGHHHQQRLDAAPIAFSCNALPSNSSSRPWLARHTRPSGVYFITRGS